MEIIKEWTAENCRIRLKKGIRKGLALGLTAGLLFFCRDSLTVWGAEKEGAGNVTVVLDPGHGGENLGGEYGAYQEKDLTLATALAMKEELEKYEGITVYLTREEDKDLSLEDRVAFAEEKNADFLFCLHYNMSLNHDLFGAEVWVSAFDEEYQKGYTFAGVEMELLREHGLYSRGIKTRMNDRGEDYYGIIRHATEASLPAVIIEHCHLDQERDQAFYTSEEGLREFGRLDATAVAKYYGLSSEELGVDYSGFTNAEIPVPATPVRPDTTEPDVCVIEVTGVEESTGEIFVALSAQDYDSHMLYYSYSLDGGVSFSDLQEWPSGQEDTVNFTIHAPSGILPEVVVRAYNGYDLYRESNHVTLPSISYEEAVPAGNVIRPGEAKEVLRDQETGAQDGHTTGKERANRENMGKDGRKTEERPKVTVTYFLTVCLLCVAILLALLLLARIILLGGKTDTSSSGPSSKKKRRRKKK